MATTSGSESQNEHTSAVATTSGVGSQNGNASLKTDMKRRNSKGKLLKESRYPSTESRKRYTTRAYPPYDPDEHDHLVRPSKTNLIMKDMEGYPLWMEPFGNPELISTACRLDDLTIANLIDYGLETKTLNERWPVEFDQKGNIRALRMPLGFAAKMYVSAGERDRNGNVATGDDEGWYYRWYRGIHLLCGDESLDKYRHRPSHEDRMPDTWYFDLEFKCYIQDLERSKEEADLLVEQRRLLKGDDDESLKRGVDEETETEGDTEYPARKKPRIASPPQQRRASI